MESDRDVALVQELRDSSAEGGWFEFKQNFADSEKIGVLVSALANSAAIHNKHFAYIIWGIADGTHELVGTAFDPFSKRVGNQNLEFWLSGLVQPSLAIDFRSVDIDNKKLVLLEIPAATFAPICFKNIPYVRMGDASPKLTEHPSRYQQLLEKLRTYAWEKSVAKDFLTGEEVLSFLNYQNYFDIMDLQVPESQEEKLLRLQMEGLIVKDIQSRWSISNLGAVLFANRLADFGGSMARKGIRLTIYDGNSKADTVSERVDGAKGYGTAFPNVIRFIKRRLPKEEHFVDGRRVERVKFPELAIREVLANALIHQDMTQTGTGPHIQLFKDRIEVTNPGAPLVEPSRIIDLPPRSRNEDLASIMRRMGLCEEEGSGVDKVVISTEVHQLPPPLFRANAESMQVILYGPRDFSDMTQEERLRACYFHATIKWISGEKMKNASLRDRLGIDSKNAAQASSVLKRTQEEGLIKPSDPEHPRSGYVPFWA